MEMKKVISSNIAAVGFDAASQALEIEFSNGTVYSYANAPAHRQDRPQGGTGRVEPVVGLTKGNT